MIAYRILRTEKTPMGFFKHPTITTPAALAEHLQQMKKDGFRVEKTALTCKA